MAEPGLLLKNLKKRTFTNVTPILTTISITGDQISFCFGSRR